jgi:hypothetical protein
MCEVMEKLGAYRIKPGPNVIKQFNTVVIYCHSMVITKVI